MSKFPIWDEHGISIFSAPGFAVPFPAQTPGKPCTLGFPWDGKTYAGFVAPPPTLLIKKLSRNAILPTRVEPGSIGLDLYADLIGDVDWCGGRVQRIGPRQRQVISTGIALAIPHTHYGRIAPRSGLALKQGIDVLAGVVDCSFRGDIRVILYNTSDELFEVKHGAKIAQLVLERADALPMIEVDQLPGSDRGANGFGSSGS